MADQDLHARITARLDRTAEYAEEVRINNEDDRAIHDLVQLVLRGLAEDRDILARHAPVDERPYRKLKCRHAANGPGVVWMVDWPCADVLSLARRHGIEAP